MTGIITSAYIEHGRFENQVKVTFSDSRGYYTLFKYYSDELTFFQEEFLGLTKQEALQLFHEKDMACLRP